MAGSWGDRINVAVQAVAQVLLVCGLGLWLARRRGLNRAAIAALSNINWHALIPALMFSSIVGAVTPESLASLWPLIVASVLHIVVGAVPSALLAWAARLPRDMAFFTVMASSLPNCGNLPWLFMPGVIRYYAPPAEASQQVQRMVGLVSVYTIVTVLVTLVVPFLFKRPPDTLLLPRSRPAGGEQGAGEPAGAGLREADGPKAAELQLGALGGREAAGAGKPPKDQLQRQQAGGGGGGGGGVLNGAHRVAPDEDDTHSSEDAHAPAAAPAGAEGAAAALGNAQGAAHAAAPQPQPPPDAAGRGLGLVAVASVGSGLDDMHTFELDDAAGDATGDAERGQLPPTAAHRHVPYVAGADSFASHRSGSLLLQQGRQLWGSLSRSLGRSFSRGLRRSNSRVQLVWTFPTGWQPAARSGGNTAAAAAAAALAQSQQRQHRPGRRAAPPAPRAPALPCLPWLQGGGSTAAAAPAWARATARWGRAAYAHPLFNLPLVATLAGLACAAIGPVRKLLVDDLAPLHWLWSSLAWVGAAAAPLATMQIGAELMQAPVVASSRMRVSRRSKVLSTAIAIVVKLILVPLINMAIVRNAGFGRLAPEGDTVYQLLLLVESAVPAAVTLLVVCGRVYPDSSPLSGILFWQYCASLVTLPAFLVWFLDMLGL